MLATEGQQVRVDYGDNAGLRGAHSAAGFEDGAVVVVPTGHVWLLGDNVDHSNDRCVHGGCGDTSALPGLGLHITG